MKAKKIVTLVVSLVVWGVVSANVGSIYAEEKAHILGDVDGDNMVTSVDASLVLGEYARISGQGTATFTDVQKTAADINKDGILDSVDASRILAYYAYLSTGGTLKFEEYLATPPEITTTTTTSTTSTTTTTTTTRPVTTTAKVTLPPNVHTVVAYISDSVKTNLTKYDITSEDELDAKTALENMSMELAQELFNGNSQYNQYGVLPGIDAAYAIIVNLNYNQNINIKALGDRYDCIHLDDFEKNIDNMNLSLYQYLYGTRVDFTKYTLDEELGQYINEVTDKYLDYKNKKNIDSLYEEFDDFFENNEPYDNYAKYYYMVNTKNESNYNSDEMNKARQIFFDNVTHPLYDKISQNMGKIRQKIYYYIKDGKRINYYYSKDGEIIYLPM